MVEAAAQFQKGLDQLALLPDNFEHQRLELEFRSSLGAVLMAAKGIAALETGRAYARARELWEQLGSPSDFLHIPYGQSRHHLFRGEFDLASAADGHSARCATFKIFVTGLFPLARAFSKGRIDKSKYKQDE